MRGIDTHGLVQSLHNARDLRKHQRPADLLLEPLGDTDTRMICVDVSIVNASTIEARSKVAVDHPDGHFGLREAEKCDKYTKLCNDHNLKFVPFVMDNRGGLAPQAQWLIGRAGHLASQMHHTSVRGEMHRLRAQLAVGLVAEAAEKVYSATLHHRPSASAIPQHPVNANHRYNRVHSDDGGDQRTAAVAMQRNQCHMLIAVCRSHRHNHRHMIQVVVVITSLTFVRLSLEFRVVVSHHQHHPRHPRYLGNRNSTPM